MASPVLTGLSTEVTFAEDAVNAARDADRQRRHPHRSRQQLRRRHADGLGPSGEGHGRDPQPGHRRGRDRRLRRHVSFGGTVIGSFAGGAGTTLTVTFNAAATSAAIEALIENLTYANSSDTPTASRAWRSWSRTPTAPLPPVFSKTGTTVPFNPLEAGRTARRPSATSMATATPTCSSATKPARCDYYKNTGTSERAGLREAGRHRQSAQRVRRRILLRAGPR